MHQWKQIVALLILFCGTESTGATQRPIKQNVILMISDGMGPSALTHARNFKQKRDRLPLDTNLSLEKCLVGTLRTYSSSSLVTDSAAAGTALHTGFKTYNGAISVDSQGIPRASILEALKLDGYLTGLVVTTHITDATPGTLSAHAGTRKQEDEIAQQQIGEHPLGQVVDLILGGGRCHFLPESVSGGCRKDSRNLVNEAVRKNYTYVENRPGFDLSQNGKNVSLPLLGLLATEDIPYDIDRDSSLYPSLADQAQTALTALSKASEDSTSGFFLLIEGSRIDHAGHQNDAASHVREVLAYNDAFEAVKKFIDSSKVLTLVVSTSDHETGGLSVARQVGQEPDYLWYPEVRINIRHSGEYLAEKIVAEKNTIRSKFDSHAFTSFITSEILEKHMGIFDYSQEEVKALRQFSNSLDSLSDCLNKMVSLRSQTGWTTTGHSAVDVNVYAYTNDEYIGQLIYHHSGFLGNHDNTEIALFIELITGTNLTNASKLLLERQKEVT